MQTPGRPGQPQGQSQHQVPPPGQQQQQQQLPPGAPSTSGNQLDNAAQAVEDRIAADSTSAPDLEHVLRDSPSSSLYLEPPNPRWDPFVQKRTVNVPAGLLDSCGADLRLRLGLFPEIGRAWIACDNRLFLWDYSGSTEAGSLLTYDEETEPISAVGLVAPKKAVFLDAIQYVLVICTAISVRLVGVRLEPSQSGAAPRLSMYETDRRVGTDGVAATAVCGTPEGRIFLACEDGALRELDYRAESTWLPWQLSALCSLSTISPGHTARGLFNRGQHAPPVSALLAYDPTRHYLYTCTSTSLEAYALGSGGTDKPHRVAHVTDLCKAAQAKCPNSPMLEAAGFAIVALNVIGNDESNNVAVVLTTSNCVRLFFSLGYSYGYYAGASSSQLNLLHVRLPPNPSAANGHRYAAQPGPQQQQGQQTYILRDLRAALQAKRGLFLAANEERIWFAAAHQPTRGGGGGQPQQPSQRAEVAMTVDLPGGTFALAECPPKGDRREFVALNSSLAAVFAQQRPVDTLASLLEGGDRNELQAFASDNTAEQSCALCLALACGGTVGQDVASAARRLFLDFGNAANRPGGSYGPDGRPMFSPLHGGFAIYLARQLKPIWRLKVTQPAPSPEDPARQDSAVPETMLASVQRNLNGLKGFADNEPGLFQPLPEQVANRPDGHILQAERASLIGLRSLLVQAVEALSFVLLLIDFRLPEIVATCTPELKQSLANLTYKDLLATHQGRDVVRKLVHIIINHRISQGESVDAVSDLLEQRCGSFCSADDILVYKASESVRTAIDAPNKLEQNRHLRESLQLFLKAAKHIDAEKLKEVCAAYQDVGYLTGAIELCLACAKATTVDERRTSAYDCALGTLDKANELLDAAHAGQSSRSVEEADGLREAAFKRALDSNEEAFHHRLYAWYLERRLLQQLLNVRTSYLENFLLKPPVTQLHYDLLWQLYVRKSEFAKAAKVLAMLAESEHFGIGLEKRLEYLSLAAGNARSQFPAPAVRQEMSDFLTAVDEKLEVAQVQIEIVRAIQQAVDLEGQYRQEMLQRLDGRLFSISDLFNEFAEPLNMLEIMLLIFYVSDHHDEELIANTWTAIFSREAAKPDGPHAKKSKVRELGRRFHPSEAVFPIDMLVSMLEQDAFHAPPDAAARDLVGETVVDAFLEAGVAYEQLARAYVDLFNSKIPPWHTKQASTHLALATISLFERWAQAATSSAYVLQHGDFPAPDVLAQVDRFAPLFANDDETRKRIQALQRDLELLPHPPPSSPAPAPGPAPGGSCDPSALVPTLPTNQTQLVLPAGQATVHVALGLGTQNYTCNATSATYVSAGAVAKLYDLSCADKTTFATLAHDNYLRIMGILDTEQQPELTQIGDHYFAGLGGANSPIFDFRAFSSDPNAWAGLKKTGSVDVPVSTQVPEKSVALLQLAALEPSVASGTAAKTVFRLDTQGGTASTVCVEGQTTEEPYAAIYWFLA